jgi:ribonuclease HII
MSNKRYEINKEIEITIPVKVKIKQISNYHHLTKDEIDEQVKDFEREIIQHLKDKLENEYYFDEVTLGVDGWNYEIK